MGVNGAWTKIAGRRDVMRPWPKLSFLARVRALRMLEASDARH